jgi:hypothetical protein
MVAPTDEELRVIQKMQNEDPTPEELETFKKYMERRAKAETETVWRIRRGPNYNPFKNESSTK